MAQQFSDSIIIFLGILILIGTILLHSLFFYIFSKKFNFRKKDYKTALFAALLISIFANFVLLIYRLILKYQNGIYLLLIGIIVFLINLFIFQKIYQETWKRSLIVLILSNILVSFIGSILISIIKMLNFMRILS